MNGEPISTMNRFLVGVRRDRVEIMRPVPASLTKEESLNLAAYLCLMADPAGGEFKRHLEAIQNA